MSLVRQFLTALYRFGSYPELVRVKGIRVFAYAALMVIFTTGIMIVPLVPAYHSMGGMVGFAEKYIPDFVLEDGKLTMDRIDYTDRLNGVRIYVDTGGEALDTSMAGDSIYALVASRDEMYVFNGLQGQKLDFKELGMDLSSEGIINTLSKPEVRFGIIGIFLMMLFMGNITRAVYSILVLAIIGNVINMLVTRIPMGFGGMMKLAVYARTLPLILQLFIQVLFGFTFEPLVFYGVGGVYIYKGLKNLKTQGQDGILIADIGKYQRQDQDRI